MSAHYRFGRRRTLMITCPLRVGNSACAFVTDIGNSGVPIIQAWNRGLVGGCAAMVAEVWKRNIASGGGILYTGHSAPSRTA